MVGKTTKDDQAKAKAATLREIALLERQQKAVESRTSLITFTQFTDPHPEDPNNVNRSAYEPAAFHRAIARTLEQVVSGEITQLIFCMPPRHGKTRLATISLAAWYSGLFPHHDVICAMATDTLATDSGGAVRALMVSPQYKQVFPDHKLRRGGAAKDNIQTEQKGRLVFAGRGGTINGRGAHLLLVDDLYKDSVEAGSQTIRDQAWDWLVKVALFRRMGKKLTLLIMTRWHSDDIIGRLTDPENPHYDAVEAAQWKIIRLPGICEEDDPPESRAGREPGEALWPERYSVEYLLGSQRRDPLGFAGLVQQRPTVADGTFFKREDIKFYKKSNLPDNLQIFCASDHAVATGQRNDYTVLLKVGVSQNNDIYVLECYRRKAKADQVVEAMLTMATTGKHRPLFWWAEGGHISKSIGPFLTKRMQETNQHIRLIEVTPVRDKVQRAQSIIARVAMGKVYFPDDEQWALKMIDEMLSFPNGTHDDMVDALAYIGLKLPSQFARGGSSANTNKAQPAFGSFGWLKRADALANRDMQGRTGGF